MDLIFIYGPPGVGKLTVAWELARATAFKVFHNHVSIDWTETVFDFGTRPFGSVVGKMASLEMLREVAGRYHLFSPVPGRESLSVDNTSLAPAEVAELIVRHYHLPTV